jgi:hypothetical protein
MCAICDDWVWRVVSIPTCTAMYPVFDVYSDVVVYSKFDTYSEFDGHGEQKMVDQVVHGF